MQITFDPQKRDLALAERRLDFDDSVSVFADNTLDFEDTRHDYPERRYVCVGRLKGRMVVVVWTPRGKARHIISMRKANGREQAKYRERLG